MFTRNLVGTITVIAALAAVAGTATAGAADPSRGNEVTAFSWSESDVGPAVIALPTGRHGDTELSQSALAAAS